MWWPLEVLGTFHSTLNSINFGWYNVCHFSLVWPKYLGLASKVVHFDWSGHFGQSDRNVSCLWTKLLYKKTCWLVHISFRNTGCIVGFHNVRTCRYLEVWKSITSQSTSSHSETLQPAISNLVYLTAICVSCQIWLRHTSGNSGWKLSQDDSSLLEEHDVRGERTRRGDLRLIPKGESAESMHVMYVLIILFK